VRRRARRKGYETIKSLFGGYTGVIRFLYRPWKKGRYIVSNKRVLLTRN